MARVILSGMVSAVKGSISGTTFQGSAYGQIMRNKPIPLKSSNASQSNIRLIQSQLNYQWAALTDAQRASWNGKVNTFYRTAKQAYMGANFYLLFNGITLIESPAYNVTPSPIAPYSIELVGGGYELITDNIDVIDDYQLLIKASYPVGNTVTKSIRSLRLLNYTAIAGTTQEIESEYIAALHTELVEGSRLWISTALQNIYTGDLSAWTTKIVTCIVP